MGKIANWQILLDRKWSKYCSGKSCYGCEQHISIFALRAIWDCANMPLVDHVPGDVTIGNDVWIGLNACIPAGSSIGDGCIVGAGAVVRWNIAPYSIVIGNPAEIIRSRFDDDVVSQFLKVKWWYLPDDKVETLIPKLLGESPEEFLKVVRAVQLVEEEPRRNELQEQQFSVETKTFGL